MGDIADGDLDDEAFCACDAMAFANFGDAAGDSGEALEFVAGDGDLNEGTKGETDGGGIDLGVISADRSGVFKFANALNHGGSGEGDAAAQFGEGEAGVGLKLGENGGIDQIEAGVW